MSKSIKDNSDDFILWLEFEALNPSEFWDADNEVFNMQVTYGGQKYALNVWSYNFTRKQLQNAFAKKETFIGCPDIMVLTCTRSLMEKVVKNLIQAGGLKSEWVISEEDYED